MKVYKIGIIGCGKIVESNHLPALLNIPEVSVTWMFDKSVERTTLLSNMYNVQVINETVLQQAINEIDICLLTVPYGVRSAYIEMCAQAGKALYVEKPFATTVKEHKSYCDLFPAYKLAIGFQRRYYQSLADVKAIIQMKLFGELRQVSFKQGYFQLKGGGGFISSAAMSGGGVIIESAVHVLDQVLQFTEAENVSVSSVNGISRAGIDYDTVFTGTIGTPAGNINYDCHVSCLRNLDNGITLQFEKASLHMMPSPDSSFVVQNDKGKVTVEHFSSVTLSAHNVNKAFVMFWKDFIEALESGSPNKTNGVSSILTTQWIENVYNGINNHN